MGVYMRWWGEMIVLWHVFVDCWMHECVTSGLPLQKKPVTSLRRFYAIMFTFFLLIWSITEYNSPLSRVCIDRKSWWHHTWHDQVISADYEKVCDVTEESLWHDVRIFRWSGQLLNANSALPCVCIDQKKVCDVTHDVIRLYLPRI